MHVVSDTAVTDSVEIAEPGSVVVPVPPRFRWLKRFGKAAVVLVVAAVLFRVWWGYEAHRRLQAEIDAYRAAGQLVYAVEFNAAMDEVADAQNAAILYEQAINGIVSTSTSGVTYEEFRDEPERFNSEAVAIGELEQSNAGVFELVRQARGRTRVAWSDRLPDPLVGGRLNSLSGHRALAHLLWFSARHHFATGEHTGTIERTRDEVKVILFVARPGLIIGKKGQQVAIGVGSRGIVQQLEPGN